MDLEQQVNEWIEKLQFLEEEVQKFPVDITFKMVKYGAGSLKYVLYSDTDSSFIVLYPLLKKALKRFYPNLGDEQIERALKYDEYENLPFTKNDVIALTLALVHYIQKYVDRVLDAYAKSLNAENKFKFKQEYIFQSILISMKKHYVYRAIMREGVLIDEIGYLNIGVKSDVPEFTNKMIRFLAERILKGDSVETIKKYALSFAYQFMKLAAKKDLRTAKPQSVKKLEDYKSNNEAARAASLYRVLTGQQFFSKGYLFKIRSIDLTPEQYKQITQEWKKLFGITNPRNYFTAIFFEETIPDVKFEVDPIAQYKSFVHAKLVQLLQPLGIDFDRLAENLIRQKQHELIKLAREHA